MHHLHGKPLFDNDYSNSIVPGGFPVQSYSTEKKSKLVISNPAILAVARIG